MNSFNHYAYGAVAEWLYRHVAGIDADTENPGFHGIVFHPRFNAELGEAEAVYESAYGAIGSHWRVENKNTVWSVTIPANTTGVLYFPAKAQIREGSNDIAHSGAIKFVRTEGNSDVYEAGAGHYAFRF